jgi:SAM-dependent methyltransferase
MPAPRTSYDEISYSCSVLPQTHPNRMAALARLLGVEAAPPAACRVLEIGCGTGENLIALALGAPRSTFVGFDLCAGGIEQGQEVIRELRLTNVHLLQADVMEFVPQIPFDYVIAHGLLSWVPRPVQERLLELCRQALAPKGIAYLSYNTYPGSHVRQMLRDMMLFHAGSIAEPKARLQQARSLVKFLCDGQTRTDEYSALVRKEAEWILDRQSDSLLFHDDLAEVNTPFWFHELARQAAGHGLQFLAEADFCEMNDRIYPEAVAETLRELDGNVVLKEQYLDFLKCRRFRQTLLVHAGVAIDRAAGPERIRGLLIASAATPKSEKVDLAPGVVEAFAGRHGAAMQVDHPLAKAAMLVLQSTWPRPVPFAELAAAAGQILNAAPDEDEQTLLAQVLLAAHDTGLVEVHAFRPHWASEVSDRPRASPLLRLQLRQGRDHVTTLRPTTLLVDQPLWRELFALLDGSRNRDMITAQLRQRLDEGALTLPPGVTEGDLPALVESVLRKAATEAMLIA